MIRGGDQEQDYQRIIFANNIDIESLHEVANTAAPLRVNALTMYPLAEIETDDGSSVMKPIRYVQETFFRRGQLDCHGAFYDRDGEELYIRQLVASIPSGLERLMTRILTGGEDQANRCQVSLIRIPNERDISMAARFTRRDVNILGKMGIEDPRKIDKRF